MPAAELALIGSATSPLTPRFTSPLGAPGHAGVSPRADAHMAAVFTNMTPELQRAAMKEPANATSPRTRVTRIAGAGSGHEALIPNAGCESTCDVQSG